MHPELKSVNVVLCFMAYFNLVSPNGAIDATKKARKVNIYYYVEDGTMSIIERPQLNSGVPQGTLCARSVVWKSDGNPVGEEDFTIGGSVEIFGQTYYITDCDQSTRRYYLRSANTSPERGQITGFDNLFENNDNDDNDNLGEFSGDRNTRLGGQGFGLDNKKGEATWGQYRSKKNNNKTFMEAQLGNTVNNSGRDGFIKYGNKTLKFRCVWDNTAMLYGDMVEFSLVYFLADDTVEIFSVPTNVNSNKDQFSRLLKRSKLPKRFGFKGIGNHIEPEASSYYHWSDLFIGLEMDVYARSLRIIDADTLTKSFYENYDMPLSAKIEERQVQTAYYEREIPPSTGFGSEEDSLRSCSGPLQPGAPRIKKLGENRVLTFLGSLVSGGSDDVNRRFVLTYYVQDQTFKIEEKQIRNSGFVGGVFLSRRQIKNQEGELMCERHLSVGRVLTVFKHQFLLLETDEVTMRWMEDKMLPQASFFFVLDKLRSNDTFILHAFNGKLEERFSNQGGVDGKASKKCLISVLDSYGLLGYGVATISEHNILVIMRNVGDKKDLLNYLLFIEHITSPSSDL